MSQKMLTYKVRVNRPSHLYIDGEKVDISINGLYVDDGETTVKITPTGVVVKENGEDIVNIGLNGVTVKE